MGNAWALFCSSLWSIKGIFSRNFRALLTVIGLGEYSFFFLTVLGAIVLQLGEPDFYRPYKPFVLILFNFEVVN